MRVSVESKVEGVLEKLPQPIHVFDTVRDGQLIARVDLSLVEKQLEALRAAAATSQPGAGGGAGAGGMSSAERDAKIAELQARLDAREVKSPIDGTVMEIRQYPGEGIKLGKTLMVIAGGQGDFITGYLREDQPIRPTPGMAVTVRTRGRGGSAGAAPRRTFQTYVASVAPQFEPMPSRHLRNPNIPEWVLPVQITIPADQDLVPGEVVDLTFHARD
jgi:multidrug resistance efflux pump